MSVRAGGRATAESSGDNPPTLEDTNPEQRSGERARYVAPLGPAEPRRKAQAELRLAPSAAPPGPDQILHDRDLELAREARAGSARARREFVERLSCVPKFLAVMNARMGRPLTDDALEDLAQETLVEIWKRLDSYAGIASLRTWAYRFCQQVLSSRLRTLHRRPRNLAMGSSPEWVPALTRELDFEHVYRALDKVDSLGARIVQMKHFDQLTFEEIAPRLGVPASSAKTHYRRALERLREILDPLRKEAGL